MAKSKSGKLHNSKKVSNSQITRGDDYALHPDKRRARQLTDRARVIRKRFEDEAKRYERQAKKIESVLGVLTAEARYYYQAAAGARAQAEGFYMRNMREQFGKGKQADARITHYLNTVGEQQSSLSLVRNLKNQNARENRLAERVLSGSGGSAFYAGTVQIWRGKERDARNQAIIDFFGKENLWQVLQHFEERLGVSFFDITEVRAEMYSRESLSIMEHVVTTMAGA